MKDIAKLCCEGTTETVPVLWLTAGHYLFLARLAGDGILDEFILDREKVAHIVKTTWVQSRHRESLNSVTMCLSQ